MKDAFRYMFQVIAILLMFITCDGFGDEVIEWTFDAPTDVSKLDTSAGASIDTHQKHAGTGSLKLESGAQVVIPLRQSDGTGRVEMWIYEDTTAPADPKKHAAGPLWGLRQADGHILAVGPVYAPYLSGDTTYATAAFNPSKDERPWQEVQYLGIRRDTGWHHWTFDFQPEKGLRILRDQEDLNANRTVFNWNKSKLDGFQAIVLFGDASGAGQTLWIDQLKVMLGPAAAVTTAWPPPPPTPPADLTPLTPKAEFDPTPYSQWTNGPGTGRDYFPIAVWLQDPKLAEQYVRAGFNLYVGLWKGPTDQQLATLRRAGMQVICSQNQAALQRLNDPTIVGWMHGDEPDNAHPFDSYWKKDKQRIKQGWPKIYQDLQLSKNDYRGYGPPVPPKWIVKDYHELKKNDPTRPIMLNLGQGVAWEEYRGRGERTGHLEDYPKYVQGSDVVSFDIYPGAHSDLKVKDALWYVAQGVRRLRQWSDDQKIVWNVIESTTISDPKSKPTPSQVKAEAWMSIIHGTRGLIYFVHQFEPQFNEHALLDDPAMLKMVTAVNRQIHQLATVINSPKFVEGISARSSNPKTPVHIMAKDLDGDTFLFSVAMYAEPTDVRFQVPGVKDGAKIEVLGEDRTVLAKSGEFADVFQANDVHLYRISDRDMK